MRSPSQSPTKSFGFTSSNGHEQHTLSYGYVDAAGLPVKPPGVLLTQTSERRVEKLEGEGPRAAKRFAVDDDDVDSDHAATARSPPPRFAVYPPSLSSEGDLEKAAEAPFATAAVPVYVDTIDEVPEQDEKAGAHPYSAWPRQ
jgi:hypothetical protein